MADDKDLMKATLDAMRTMQTLNEQIEKIQQLGGTPNISIHETAPIEANILGQAKPVRVTERQVSLALEVTRPVVVERIEHRSIMGGES